MDLKSKLIQLEADLKEEQETMFAIKYLFSPSHLTKTLLSSSMTSQYKAMQEKLTKKKKNLEKLVTKNDKIIEEKIEELKRMEEARVQMKQKKKDE